MPKVGCFWPGLFKSSNCLFPWAAKETGKCSFFALQVTFQYQTVRAGGDHGIPPLPTAAGIAPVVGCATWFCKLQGWALLGGFPPGGFPWSSSRFVCSATPHPC